MIGIGALVGLLFGAAGVVVWSYAPTRRRRATVRVGWLVGQATGSIPQHRPFVAIPWLDRVFGGRPELERRLRQAGSLQSADVFRLRQLACMALATGSCIAVEFVVGTTRALAPAPSVLLVGVAAAAGLILPEWLLDRRIKKRREQMSAQLPHVAELVAFALSAGESPVAALDRVVRSTHGPLTDELCTAVWQVRGGASITDALHGLARDTGVRQIDRFVDSMLVAVERGTPLADVMRAQAADARAAAHRDLLTKAGRAEVLMLVPVIFLVLPMVVVIALYPGLANLTSAFG